MCFTCERQKSMRIARTALKTSRNTRLLGALDQQKGQTWKEFVLHSDIKPSTLPCKCKMRWCHSWLREGFLLSKHNSLIFRFHPATQTIKENSILLLTLLAWYILCLNTGPTVLATTQAEEDKVPTQRAQTFGTWGMTEIQQHSYLCFTKFCFTRFITAWEIYVYQQHLFWSKRVDGSLGYTLWDVLFFILSTSLLKIGIFLQWFIM